MSPPTGYRLLCDPLTLFSDTRAGMDAPAVCKHIGVHARGKSAHVLYAWEDLSQRFATIIARGRGDRALFYRHGATKYNQRNRVSGQHDTRLSDLGRSQAWALRDSLPPQIDLILCSTLSRTIETMHLGVPDHLREHAQVYIDARLNEVHLGKLQGRRRQYVPSFQDGDLDFAPEAGESYRSAAQRVLSLIADLFDRLADRSPSPQTAVVFAHAGVMRIISTLVYDGEGAADLFRTTHANAECLAIPAERMRLPDYWNRTNHVDDTSECHPL
ncbi:histidine phosphatase family protein [Sphingobium xenophagum]|uniref:Glucosyl-3-phosphoglycerate phosphatase n=1 Tax=Sphingobium xenophagum TaxID=121428 RepID=A0A401IYJ3_SPHXE|nr:histidine phosphatase family protein [Sphingobium xenophagum]GBH29429.1 glucosyl-3-phosphoglycerate phosphatase [Sphingobium xenophagum]